MSILVTERTGQPQLATVALANIANEIRANAGFLKGWSVRNLMPAEG